MSNRIALTTTMESRDGGSVPRAIWDNIGKHTSIFQNVKSIHEWILSKDNINKLEVYLINPNDVGGLHYDVNGNKNADDRLNYINDTELEMIRKICKKVVVIKKNPKTTLADSIFEYFMEVKNENTRG